MSYIKTNWVDGETPANAINMNKIESGIEVLDTGKEPTIATKNTAFNQNFETLTSNIKMDGTAAVGSSNNVAKSDHVHPSDTSKTNQVDFSVHLAEITPHSELIVRTITVGVGKDFTTIQASINSIKKRLDNIITINVDAGTYAEDLAIPGFVGGGYIILNGASSADDTHIVNSIKCERCSCPVFVTGFKAITTTTYAFSNSQSQYISFDKCKVDSSASQVGFTCSSGVMAISNSIISNRTNAIQATSGSILYSNNNTGSGNTYGLVANSASTIGKSGTQPGGTTAESASSGGVIR